jgi:hypothetical protein
LLSPIGKVVDALQVGPWHIQQVRYCAGGELKLICAYTGKEGDPKTMKNSDLSGKREVAEA